MKIEIGKKSVWVNYHHLYYFMVIAQERSISAASKQLMLGQSALSIQIKQFEKALEIPLFERSHRLLTLTEQGKIVFAYAKEIFKLGTEMVETLHDRPSSHEVRLQVGALTSVPKHVVAELVQQVLKKMDCSVTVVDGRSEELLRELIDHRIDLMLTNAAPMTRAGQTYAKRVARLPLWVVGGPTFLSVKKGFPQSLKGLPFILPSSESRVRHEFEDFLRSFDIKVDVLAEAHDVMIQKLMAIRGTALTVVSEFAVRDYLQDMSLHLLGRLDRHSEDLFLVAASRKIENPAATYLIKSFSVS